MNFLFNSIHYSINFYGALRKRYNEVIDCMKAKAFEHKLIYCASYDLLTQKYTVTQDYDNVWCILYFYITNYLLKLNYAGLSYTDLEFLIKVQDVVIITSYILAGKEYHAIYDDTKQLDSANYYVLYAFTDKNDDLTREFNCFQKSIALFRLQPQHIYNILTYYGNKYEKKQIEAINYMNDRDFEEKIL